ncbi:MAG: biopolymer transporter ExbD [Saprospiraceae bacterium]|uniref:Biopolymer transporter ExbD n=1 Tax=Candidatus Opimibacter skivensis TaxID=2982028 RepID=A0A9D7SX05_9BACT|nr:biopolymer transporter ExbD [Candidatus Opimibacter skivensis]
MAEMNVSGGGGHKKDKKVRGKKMSTRVDLTPMVDLGFLLITFFMLATTFNKPKTMEVNKPAKDDIKKEEEPPIKMSKTATLMLGKGDKIYAYVSPDEIDETTQISLDSIDYSPNGLRKFIQRRQNEVQAQWGNKDDLFIMIKPLPSSSFKNIVDALDEMTINDVKRYAILAPNDPIDSLIALRAGQSRK